MRETTAFGTAIAAGLAVGVWNSIHDLDQVNSDGVTTFIPHLTLEEREEKHKIWRKAIESSLHWTDDVEVLSSSSDEEQDE